MAASLSRMNQIFHHAHWHDSVTINRMTSKLKLRMCQRVMVSIRRNYATGVPRDILQLMDRGIFKELVNAGHVMELKKQIARPMTAYCGFDPTADSLHLGNLLTIIALIHCQRGGHKPLCLLGGATALIGDPSGVTKDRVQLQKDVVEKNVQSIRESLYRIFDNHKKLLWKHDDELQDLEVLDNADWYKDKNVVDFLSVVGRHFRMGDMLDKESVKSRLASIGGMGFTEFTYQLFQAYDWLHLYLEHNCQIQIGGSDQRGNISAGFEFIRKVKTGDIWGLTIPLLTEASGQKFGKSANNAIWLNPDRTTPYELYQYFINRTDMEVEHLLKVFTFISNKEINDQMVAHRNKPDERAAQKKLASHVVQLVHGMEGYKQAKFTTKVLHGGKMEDIAGLSEEELRTIFKGAKSVSLQYEPDITLMEMCMKAECFVSKNEGLSLFTMGGVYLNLQRVTEPDYVIVRGQHILPNDITLIRIGKKKYFLVKWYSS